MQYSFDYIILGGGASGLSLALEMVKQPTLSKKSIAIIEREPKTDNDRTWCYWQEGSGPFDSILSNEWSQLLFKTPSWSNILDINPYKYKMLRSADFYKFSHETLHKSGQVSFVLADIHSAKHKSVHTNQGEFIAKEYIFNSVFSEKKVSKSDHHLIQHFKGWFIKTEKSYFSQPTFMDFSIPQDYGCDFAYVLPLSADRALVEFTSFSKEVLPDEVYDKKLRDYISQDLGITTYVTQEVEKGMIPMETTYYKTNDHGYIINIGIAGGLAKPSTGYTFSFIQKQSKQMVQNLTQGKHPLHASKAMTTYDLLDAVFLRVMVEKEIPAYHLFELLFQKLPAPLVLKFLNEETSFWEVIQVMNSMPKLKFTPAAFKEIAPYLKKRSLHNKYSIS